MGIWFASFGLAGRALGTGGATPAGPARGPPRGCGVLSVALVVLAAAALCWPAGVGRGRLIELGRRRVPAQVVATGPGSIKRSCLLLVVPAAGRGALLAGMAGLFRVTQ